MLAFLAVQFGLFLAYLTLTAVCNVLILAHLPLSHA